ncbi:MAG: AAA domain-containing protein [Chitinivibrionales bacterium]|nr:AAA domain-containing protein [Chitinivibrionales bacterium]
MSEHDLGLVGVSLHMENLRRQIRTMAQGDFPILIQGQSGTGKEMIARAVHACSRRAGREMVTVNCAAIPKQLEESEFFGHAKGAFTGADRPKEGLVSRADGSTLFLDEIGETSGDIQAKLLRVLDMGEFIPVGSTEARHVDIRIVSATNRDLEEMVDRGYFREDLFYRLKGIVLSTEPLHKHPEDIAVLVDHFVEGQAYDAGVRGVAPGAMRRLLAYHWPGNVRELRYTVDVLCMAAQGKREIDEATVRTILDLNVDPEAPTHDPYAEAKSRVLEDFDRRYFTGLLRECGGNVSQVARIAGMYRPSVQRKLVALEIDPSSYRPRRRSRHQGPEANAM